jgi:hypothetical protein
VVGEPSTFTRKVPSGPPACGQMSVGEGGVTGASVVVASSVGGVPASEPDELTPPSSETLPDPLPELLSEPPLDELSLPPPDPLAELLPEELPGAPELEPPFPGIDALGLLQAVPTRSAHISENAAGAACEPRLRRKGMAVSIVYFPATWTSSQRDSSVRPKSLPEAQLLTYKNWAGVP